MRFVCDRTYNISIAAIALTQTFLHVSDNVLTDNKIQIRNIFILESRHKKSGSKTELPVQYLNHFDPTKGLLLFVLAKWILNSKFVHPLIKGVLAHSE